MGFLQQNSADRERRLCAAITLEDWAEEKCEATNSIFKRKLVGSRAENIRTIRIKSNSLESSHFLLTSDLGSTFVRRK